MEIPQAGAVPYGGNFYLVSVNLKANKRESHVQSCCSFKNYVFWTLLTYKSACYGVNPHCMHNITVTDCEPNNEFSPLQSE